MSKPSRPHDDPPSLSSRRDGNSVVVTASGTWTLESGGAAAATGAHEDATLRGLLGETGVTRCRFATDGVGAWDSTLVMAFLAASNECEAADVEVDPAPLPEGIRQLLELARAVPEMDARPTKRRRAGFVERVGEGTVAAGSATRDVVAFIGETTLAFGRLARLKIGFRPREFGVLLQECGAGALPIVGLIALLTGLILAFVGAVQLRQFGAEIYVADLVGLAMAREMGALMTGIILAGRSGAAFAAHIGSMKSNEEIDALVTLGINPIDYLVVPRVIALVIMMPLLCLYADLIGIGGGLVIGVTLLDQPFVSYWNETRSVVDLTEISIGVVKSVVFGAIVAASGCYYGTRSGTNAAAVGNATTSAVVAAIVYIVVADAVFAVALDALDL